MKKIILSLVAGIAIGVVGSSIGISKNKSNILSSDSKRTFLLKEYGEYQEAIDFINKLTINELDAVHTFLTTSVTEMSPDQTPISIKVDTIIEKYDFWF